MTSFVSIRCSSAPSPEGPPRKDPELRFRRFGNKDSGGCYIYREKVSWWKGDCSSPWQEAYTSFCSETFLTCGVSCRAEVPRIRVRDKQERINNLWGTLRWDLLTWLGLLACLRLWLYSILYCHCCTCPFDSKASKYAQPKMDAGSYAENQ